MRDEMSRIVCGQRKNDNRNISYAMPPRKRKLRITVG